MNQVLSVSIVLVVLLPALAALWAAKPNSKDQAGAIGSLGAGLAALLAALVLAVLAFQPETNGTLTIGVAGIDLGIGVNRVTGALLLLVTGVSCLVQNFAGRYLRGDIRLGRFFLGAGLLTSATALMVAATTPLALAIGWSASGLAVLALLGMYPGLRGAEEGRRSAKRVFILGDAALWVAVAISLTAGSKGALLTGAPAETGALATEAMAVLLLIAALSRSAQLPFRSWLPGTIAVPTPVSALLHAGVVNAGGILLLKTNGVFGASGIAMHAAFVAGAMTAIYATFAMITRADVKGSLAHSTTGQMGFMLMTCGLGAWVATLFHLIGHSLYKASLFLGSGSAVGAESARLGAPPAVGNADRRSPTRLAFSLIAPAAVLAAFALAWYPELNWTSGAILAFAWVTLTWGTYGWLNRSPGAAGVARVTLLMAAVAAGYVALISLAYGFVGSFLPAETAAAASPLWLLLFLPVALGGVLLRARGTAGQLGRAAYVFTLNVARPDRSRAPDRTARRRLPGPGTLMPRSEGARS